MILLEKIIALGFLHALTDTSLQTEWMGFFKARVPYYNRDGKHMVIWPWVLMSHSMVNGGGVWLLTGNMWLGLAETSWHFITDYLSSNKHIPFWADQLSHGISKVIWGYLW